MEEVLADHPDVAECAVLGVDDKLKGQVPVGFMVLNAGVDRDHQEIIKEVVQMVRDRIGPVASFKTATCRQATAQNPLRQDPARARSRRSPTTKQWNMPATIDDPVRSWTR
jgi:propionyl-CoA synthetase